MSMLNFRLYLITDRKVCRIPFLECVEIACKSGVKAIQLREKDLCSRELLDIALRIREITSMYNVKLFINDRIDIAMIVNADGVQIPENGLPVNIAKRLLPDKLIGVSCHTIERVLLSEKQGADFIVLGSVFKEKEAYKSLGLENLNAICKKTKIPVFAVGGINAENASLCIKAGAFGVAVISAIMTSNDVDIDVRKLIST